MPELSVESETEGLKEDFWWRQIASNPLAEFRVAAPSHIQLRIWKTTSPHKCVFSSRLQFRLFITAPPNLRVLCFPSLPSPNALHPASPGILFCALSTNAAVAVQPQKRSKSLLNRADAHLSSPSAAQHIFSITKKRNWPTLSFYFTCTTLYADDFSLGISNKMLVSFPSL